MDKCKVIYHDPELQSILKLLLNAFDDCQECEYIKYNKTVFLDSIFQSVWVCRNIQIVSDNMLDWIKYLSIEYIEADSDIYFTLEEAMRKTYAYMASKIKELGQPLSYLSVDDQNHVVLCFEEKHTLNGKDKNDHLYLVEKELDCSDSFSLSFREHLNILKELESICGATVDNNLIISNMVGMIRSKHFDKTTLKEFCNKVDINIYLLKAANLITQPYEEHRTNEDTDTWSDKQKIEIAEIIFVFVSKLIETLQSNNFFNSNFLDYHPLPLNSNEVCFFKRMS